MNRTGLVLEIQRMSTEDGPGLRTTVFLKGCPLKCRWCHNPESIKSDPEILWSGHACLHCLKCVHVCERKAVRHTDDKIVIDSGLCNSCGMCLKSCPTNALEIAGKEWYSGELAVELLKDRVFFEVSGGGVTVSGGEALLQDGFTLSLLAELKKENIHTAIDTCGLFPAGRMENILNLTDLILYDIKEIDPVRHKEFTGADNAVILQNLTAIMQLINEKKLSTEIWIRTPVIPGATDAVENIRKIAEFLSDKQNSISKWELCSFNNLCNEKYRRLGIQWEYEHTPLMQSEEMDFLVNAALDCGIDKSKIAWTGMTRKE
ncbi:MAG: glycyl-radical enzyme activating protein [Spirochaetes bacterium]|nr:glycyl-radical enzyme activating protein [Spirochaetota bacterium]